MMNNKVYQVSELNEAARLLLERGFAQIAVEGEISNLARPSSGHLYFSLKDEQASLSCVLFKGNRFTLRMPWEQINNGLQVRLQGRLSLYAPRGQYQLIANQLELAGLGALEREYQARLQRLQAEGLFALERKQAIPARAMRIGVITSPSGAALQDVLNTLKRRNPAAEVVIYPCMVQGKEAPAQIYHALQAANRRLECEVLLLVRGGGSLEDLWAFNDEHLARAIVHSALPIISGVGHEIDTTLADFAADCRAATPTAAAEMVSPFLQQEMIKLHHHLGQIQQRFLRYQQQAQRYFAQLQTRLENQDPRRQLENRQQRVDELQNRLQKAIVMSIKQKQSQQQYQLSRLKSHHPQQLIASQKQHLLHFSHRLQNYRPQRLLLAQKQSLSHFAHRLQLQDPQQRLAREQQYLHNLQQQLHGQIKALLMRYQQQHKAQQRQITQLSPLPYVRQQRQQLQRFSHALARGQSHYQQQLQQRFALVAQRLSLLNPLGVLARGYGLAQDAEGKVIASVQAVAIGQPITLRLYDGQLQCEVQAKQGLAASGSV